MAVGLPVPPAEPSLPLPAATTGLPTCSMSGSAGNTLVRQDRFAERALQLSLAALVVVGAALLVLWLITCPVTPGASNSKWGCDVYPELTLAREQKTQVFSRFALARATHALRRITNTEAFDQVLRLVVDHPNAWALIATLGDWRSSAALAAPSRPAVWADPVGAIAFFASACSVATGLRTAAPLRKPPTCGRR